MQTVFISYSHKDSDFADRLALDLRESDVPATYDKWLLHVGDSIIEKISSTVSEADSVIALLSPTSIKSQWVKKELAIAMMGEINQRQVKVLPALLKDCELPPILADKLYADFTSSYYNGLRSILASLCPSIYSWEPRPQRLTLEAASNELKQLLSINDIKPIEMSLVRNWFATNPNVLVALFGHLWLVAEAIPKFRLGHEVVDFLSINGQSFRYSFSIIQLDEPDLVNVARDDLTLKAQKLQDLVIWCKKHKDKVRQSAALRLANHYGAAQIVSDGHALDIDAKLVCGRRTHFNAELNELRNKIYESTKAKVEIVSYDRVVDALDQMLRYRY